MNVRSYVVYMIWFVVSVALIFFAMINMDNGSLLIYLLLILGSLMVINLVGSDSPYKYSINLLPALIVSFVSSIALLENYVIVSENTQDGIGISNFLAYMYIGEGSWSVHMFQKAYELSFSTTLALSLLLITVMGVEWNINKQKRKALK